MKTADITDRQVCQAAYLQETKGGRTLTHLIVLTAGAPEKVALRAIERAYNRGYVDIGVSTGTAFLTNDGASLLRDNGNA